MKQPLVLCTLELNNIFSVIMYTERKEKKHKASCFAKTCSCAFNLITVQKEEKFLNIIQMKGNKDDEAPHATSKETEFLNWTHSSVSINFSSCLLKLNVWKSETMTASTAILLSVPNTCTLMSKTRLPCVAKASNTWASQFLLFTGEEWTNMAVTWGSLIGCKKA